MAGRIHFTTLSHEELPQAYAAADVFVLGSLFETFGIVYIEALAMGLPVFCTNHPNQRAIVQDGIFLDMNQAGALSHALQTRDPARLAELRQRGPEIARTVYSLEQLRADYLTHYRRISETQLQLPRYTLGTQVRDQLRGLGRRLRGS